MRFMLAVPAASVFKKVRREGWFESDMVGAVGVVMILTGARSRESCGRRNRILAAGRPARYISGLHRVGSTLVLLLPARGAPGVVA